MSDYERITNNGKTKYVHTLVAEFSLGRKLLKGECVHHIDNNRSNNNSKNLMVFKTKGDHSRFHKYNNDTSTLIKENGIFTTKKKYICSNCGKVRDRDAKSGLCISCYKELKKEEYMKSKGMINKKNLISNFKENNSILAVSKIYGISDNGLRKWLDKFDIPKKRKERSKYLKDFYNE